MYHHFDEDDEDDVCIYHFDEDDEDISVFWNSIVNKIVMQMRNPISF